MVTSVLSQDNLSMRWNRYQHNLVCEQIGHPLLCFSCQCNPLISFLRQVQGDLSGQKKLPVDLILGYSAILLGKDKTTVAAHQLLELSELYLGEVFTNQNSQPVLDSPTG